ncbi:MAG TPA: tol-pal system protein YbgF [Oceanospirillaceae bacterium]|nr:tol-pal system protein YbgF [Oceanospirillaceae bacterium]
MRTIKSFSLLTSAFAVCVLGFSLPALAATQVLVPVEDLSVSTPSAQAQRTAANQAQAQHAQRQNANAELFLLLESLQQEVSQMRGQVEELTFKLRQMQNNQKDRYLDLDRRIGNLNEQASQAAQNTLPAAPIQPHTVTTAAQATAETPQQPVTVQIDPAQHQADYKAAFNLIRSKEYQPAIAALQAFVANYPQGPLTGNAHYWLGEVHMVERQTEAAIEQFTTVITKFSDHRKVPDAMYKAGRAWLKLGDKVKGERLLDQVIRLYPDSSAARLARELK